MSAISASMVKELRDTTGAGMMDCKAALTETGGEMEAAVDWLRKKGLAKAAKKSGRTAAEGLVVAATRDGAGVLVQVPGLQDPSRLKELLGKTAKLTFRMVDQTHSVEEALQGRVPPESELLKGSAREGGQSYLIEKRVLVSGEDLTDAQPGFDHRTSEPIVTFRFNSNGARRFAQATQENVGRPFAIVLDNEVISAPRINSPILGGSGQISGSFTDRLPPAACRRPKASARPRPWRRSATTYLEREIEVAWRPSERAPIRHESL